MKIRETLKNMLHNKMFIAGATIFVFVLMLTVFAKYIAPHHFSEANINDALLAPSAQYPFGTDQYGRCIFSRVIYGSQIALKVGMLVVTVETLIGVSLGLIAGYYGSWADKAILFITDLTWSMPPLIIALAIVTMLGPSLNNVVIAIAVVSWAQFTRVVRTKTQSIKNLPYVEAAKVFGESDFNIMLRYILPNVASSIIVLGSLALPSAILSTTSLGFLGLGAQPPAADWGLILSDGTNYIKSAPWISIFPGLAIMLTVLGFNLLGEGLRDFLDPRLK